MTSERLSLKYAIGLRDCQVLTKWCHFVTHLWDATRNLVVLGY